RGHARSRRRYRARRRDHADVRRATAAHDRALHERRLARPTRPAKSRRSEMNAEASARRVALVRLVVANLLYALGLGQFYLLPKPFSAQGGSPGEVGFFMAILVVAPLVLMPFCGMLVDRTRRVPLLIGAYAAMAGLDLLLANT